jgi:integrase
MEYRTPNISPTTLNSTYEPVVAHFRKCKTDGLKNPLKFRTELLKATTESQARRSLMQISAACDWGLKHNLIQENPFSSMYLDMLQSKAPPPVAFTVEERDGQRPAQGPSHHLGLRQRQSTRHRLPALCTLHQILVLDGVPPL